MSHTRPWIMLALLAVSCRPGLAAPDGTDARPAATNVALGKTVIFNTPPNYPDTTDPEEPRQLVDGKFAATTPIWFDKATVGWVLVDPTVFTLDLGAVRPLRGVGLHMGAGQAGVEWPTSIQLYVSDDGKRYSYLGNLMEMLAARPPAQGYASFWLVANSLQTHGRFVKFVCGQVNLGTGAYTMIDEVEVYQGEAAWLQRPLVWPEAPESWEADWQSLKWQAEAASVAPSERPRPLTVIDHSEHKSQTPSQYTSFGKTGLAFHLQGEAGWPRTMFWNARLPHPISTEKCRWAVLSYKAKGIRRTYEPKALVALQGMNDKSATNEIMLLEANVALNDGQWHTLVQRLPEGFTFQQLRVSIYTEDDRPELMLRGLELLSEPPAHFGEVFPTLGQPFAQGRQPVNLESLCNGSLAAWFDRVIGKYGTAIDGARALPEGQVLVSGAPFMIGPPDRNLALIPDTPEKSRKMVFLEQEIDSRNLGPISRDDSLSVAVDAQAREAFLLLALAAAPTQPRGGLPYNALRLDDVECLSVELTYDKGPSETAFPYSLADRGCYIPCRMLGAYAVAVDPSRRLKKLTLHARQFTMGWALAGLTLNTGDKPVVAALAEVAAPEEVAQHPAPPARPINVKQEGKRLTIGNRWYEYGFNLSDGFSLDRLVNRTNPATPIKLNGESGLRVRVGDTLYTGHCFRSEVVRTTPTAADLKLTSTRAELPLEIALTITAHDTPELTFATQLRNTGTTPLQVDLCLPALERVILGDLKQTRMFFPQYRTVDTADTLALRAPYGPEFSGQFMDIYSRPAGIGLMVRTDNREQRMAEFALRKDDFLNYGVSGGVWFPGEFMTLPPGRPLAYPTVSLFAHGGDWHTALSLYRDWLKTWYRPVKSQDEPFFLRAWDLQCYRPSDKLSMREARVPAPISPDRKRWFIDETFAFEKRNLGHVPDLLHFYNWTYSDAKDRCEYGVYGSDHAYAQVGGLEFFRDGVQRIQEHWGVPLSLYTLPDRFRASALPDQKLGQELAAAAKYKAVENDDSAALRGAGYVEGIFFPPFGDKRWTDYFISDIAKMQRDTGCKMVYMDVFPRFSHLRGVPGLSPRDDDLNVAKRVREALPDEVAIWTEYPLTDVASQQFDGSLQYYFLELNETFARPYNRAEGAGSLFADMPMNVWRFSLPRYRSVCLPGYIEASNKPGQVDAVFVNGEVFHEDTFRQHYSRLRERINRAYVVKHRYSDCFGSEQAVPHVPTAVAGITANLFPGKTRNVWTLFNGRPKTYTGTVLIVPHQPGAQYRDAWHDRPLTPVIEKGKAKIVLRLDPQQPGCIVQEWRAR